MKKLGIAILIILFVAVVASGVYFVFFQDSSLKIIIDFLMFLRYNINAKGNA